MAHGNPVLAQDTTQAVLKYLGAAIVLVDGVHWERFEHQAFPCPTFQGLRHGYFRSNYKNYCLGLKTLSQVHPDADWFCYMEQDVLPSGDGVKADLAQTDAWLLGPDFRKPHNIWNRKPLADILGLALPEGVYMLGCCHFISKQFMAKVLELNVFDKVLEATKKLPPGAFPGYGLHAFEEDLLPTVCHALGGKLQELSWGKTYCMRYRPDVLGQAITPNTSLIHPSKDVNSGVRFIMRGKRKLNNVMHNKVISVCPAGRRRMMRLLAYYLLKNRPYINRHDWWINTQDKRDLDYIDNLCEQYPTFFYKVNLPIPYNHNEPGYMRIRHFFTNCQDEEALYLRFDDDIVWMAPDAIPNLILFRVQNPDALVCYGNVINNTIANHLHQRFGVIPYNGTFAEYGRMGANAISREMGLRAHEAFFNKLANHKLDEYKFHKWVMHHWEGGFSINVICWYGKDMKEIGGKVEGQEELFITIEWPKRASRYNATAGEALFSHFSYGPQRLHGHEPLIKQYESLVEGDTLFASLPVP